MKVSATAIPDVKLIEPRVFGDERGFFMETWNESAFREAGIDATFVQDNHSRSIKNTLRGLHYQIEQPQGKLVRVTRGAVYDVVVDLRVSSPTFGMWVGECLSAENHRMLWIPPGFAHGFLATTDISEFQYKCTDYYAPQYERTIKWNDPTIGINWGTAESKDLIISSKDQLGLTFEEAKTEILKS